MLVSEKICYKKFTTVLQRLIRLWHWQWLQSLRLVAAPSLSLTELVTVAALSLSLTEAQAAP